MNIPCPFARKRDTSLAILLGLSLWLACSVWPPATMAQPLPGSGQPAAGDILLAGKLSCALKQAVIMPFPGVITALSVQAGQQVSDGETLARYRLPPDAVAQIRSRLSPTEIKELELSQTKLAAKLRELQTQKAGLEQLARKNLTSQQSLDEAAQEMTLATREKANVAERLAWARQRRQDDLTVLQRQLGLTLTGRNIPAEGRLTAPLTGHVIWIHPDMRVGAEFKAEERTFLIGTLDTMVVKSQVHELEAMRLKLDDPAEVEVISLPGKKFPARVTRVSWSSLPSAADQPAFFEVEFSVPNPQHILKDGLKVRLVVPKAPKP